MRWDDWRTGCPSPLAGGAASSADVTPSVKRMARRMQRSRPRTSELRRLCGRRDTERSEWRGGRAGAPRSGSTTARHRVWRAHGVTRWPVRSDQSAASRAKRRSGRQAGWLPRSGKQAKPAIPGRGNGPPPMTSGWPDQSCNGPGSSAFLFSSCRRCVSVALRNLEQLDAAGAGHSGLFDGHDGGTSLVGR